MVHVFPDQARQSNIQDLNEAESSWLNKHIQFEYSSSADEEDIVLENPPTQLSDQQGNDVDTEYISETSLCDQGFISLACTSSHTNAGTHLFLSPERPTVQHFSTSPIQPKQHLIIQQIPPTVQGDHATI